MIMHANEENFTREVLQSPEPTVVDFWAPWCGPCQRLAPALEQFAQAHRIVKVNIDEAPALARRYQVSSVPTLLRFVDGRPGPALVGPNGAAGIERWLAAQA